MSSYVIQWTDDEIDQMLNLTHDQEDRAAPCTGHELRSGVAQGIEWACGLGGGAPPLP